MDELEMAAYRFMNIPRNDKEKLEEIIQCDIIQAIKDGFDGHIVRKDTILNDVKWLVETVQKQQKEIHMLDSAVEQDQETKDRYANEIGALLDEIKQLKCDFKQTLRTMDTAPNYMVMKDLIRAMLEKVK